MTYNPRPDDPSIRALALIRVISEAATTPSRWGDFVRALARDLGDAAVAMTLELPSAWGPLMQVHRENTDPAFTEVFGRFQEEDRLPWKLTEVSNDHFMSLAKLSPDADLDKTDFYREYMLPQGLLPEAPLGHMFAFRGGRALAGIAIYRRLGCRALTEVDLEMLDLLVPHLAQAYVVHEELRGQRQRRDALAEVVDRFPNGVILLDAQGQVVEMNRVAERIIASNDGFEISDGRVHATLTDSDACLQERLRDVLSNATGTDVMHDEALAIERPSARRPLSVIVSSLLAAAEFSSSRDVIAALFISDPEDRQLPMRKLLGSLYDLTPAESELAALICEGETIERAAEMRGVSIHTARSQLKAVFRKTGARRQGDLVALVLGGLSALEEQPPARGVSLVR